MCWTGRWSLVYFLYWWRCLYAASVCCPIHPRKNQTKEAKCELIFQFLKNYPRKETSKRPKMWQKFNPWKWTAASSRWITRQKSTCGLISIKLCREKNKRNWSGNSSKREQTAMTASQIKRSAGKKSAVAAAVTSGIASFLSEWLASSFFWLVSRMVRYSLLNSERRSALWWWRRSKTRNCCFTRGAYSTSPIWSTSRCLFYRPYFSSLVLLSATTSDTTRLDG